MADWRRSKKSRIYVVEHGMEMISQIDLLTLQNDVKELAKNKILGLAASSFDLRSREGIDAIMHGLHVVSRISELPLQNDLKAVFVKKIVGLVLPSIQPEAREDIDLLLHGLEAAARVSQMTGLQKDSEKEAKESGMKMILDLALGVDACGVSEARTAASEPTQPQESPEDLCSHDCRRGECVYLCHR